MMLFCLIPVPVCVTQSVDLQVTVSPGSCWSSWFGWASASWGGFVFPRWTRCGGICPHHTLKSWEKKKRKGRGRFCCWEECYNCTTVIFHVESIIVNHRDSILTKILLHYTSAPTGSMHLSKTLLALQWRSSYDLCQTQSVWQKMMG